MKNSLDDTIEVYKQLGKSDPTDKFIQAKLKECSKLKLVIKDHEKAKKNKLKKLFGE